LNPGGAHAIADLARGDVRSHGDDLADGLVAERWAQLDDLVMLTALGVVRTADSTPVPA